MTIRKPNRATSAALVTLPPGTPCPIHRSLIAICGIAVTLCFICLPVLPPAFAQQTTQPAPIAAPALPDIPPISSYTPAVPTVLRGTPPVEPTRSAPTGLDLRRYLGTGVGPFIRPRVPPLFAGNGDRLRPLVRDGKLYLSARDAIALAIENNLDVEIERYNLILADTDRRRAAGGGSLRGIDYTIEEPPNGVGGPGSPLLSTESTNANPAAPTITDLTSLNSTTQTQVNLSGSSTATAQYAFGPAVPLFDPNLFLSAGFLRRSDTVTLTNTAGTGTETTGTTAQAQPLDYGTLNLSFLQGFRTGGQLEATVNNDSQVIFGSQSMADPFSTPSTSVTFTQPLLRGFGPAVSLRFVHIANENRKISRLLFEQQVLETIYGTSRIYFDLVSLGENVAVKQDSLRAAEKLEQDNADQVELGTLAPIELTRAHALVSSSQFDLIQAQGLYRTQEVILRNLLTRPDSPVFNATYTEIVPTDTINVPAELPATPIGDLIQQGLAHRPDLAQSELQIKTGQISAAASRNQALPQLNAYANVETRGSSEQAYEQLGTQGTGIPTLPQNFALGGLRVSTIVQGGVQLNLPIRNRVATADAARDQVQVRQVQARTEKLENQIRQDIENAEIALETSFAAYQAAVSSRGYQQQLLQAERDKLEFGQSTNLLVIQNEAYLAQARSTEIAARSNYQKAQIELDRNLGDLLEKNGISLEDAVQGTVKP
jgi:outer membrane protein